MIAQLRGYVVRVAAPTLVLDVNGVGYRVSVPASVLENLPPDGTPLTLITHMQVREDDMSLFGFLDDQELEVFNLLLSVSGVGPKASLAMLSALGSVGIAKAVAGEDVRTLTKVPGIGTRTAQRLVVDLRRKCSQSVLAEARHPSQPAEVSPALQQLRQCIPMPSSQMSYLLYRTSGIQKRMPSRQLRVPMSSCKIREMSLSLPVYCAQRSATSHVK